MGPVVFGIWAGLGTVLCFGAGDGTVQAITPWHQSPCEDVTITYVRPQVS